MPRLLAVFAVIIAIPLLFIAMLMVILSNPENYRDQISDSVKASTGYDLQINGEISWRYWPPIALEVNDVSLNIPGDDTPLVVLESAAIDLDLLPLITGSQTIGVSALSVHGLILRPVIDKKGRGNWEIDAPDIAPITPADKTSTSTSQAADSDDSSMSFQLHIAGIDLTDATIDYRDESTGDHYLLKINSLTTGSVEYDSPFKLQMRFEVEDLNQQISATGSIDGTLTTNAALDQLGFDNLVIITRAQVPDVGQIDSTLTLTGEVNLGEDTLQIQQGRLQLGEFQPAFSITLENMSSDELQIEGEVQVPLFNPRLLLDQFQVEFPETADADALTQMSFNTNFAGNLDRVELKDMRAVLDSTHITGSLILVTGSKTDITFDLALDEINASDYLEPDETREQTPLNAAGSASGSPAGAPAKQAAIQDSELIPIEQLAEVDIAGTFAINKLHYDAYTFHNFKLDIQNKDGGLHSNLGMEGYDGTINLDIKSLWRGNISTTFRVKVSGIDLAKLSDSESITGTLDLSSDLVFQGAMLSEAMKSLNGTSRFNIQNGALDVRTVKALAATIDTLRGKPSGVSEWPDNMPFKLLTGNHHFNQGTRANQTFDFTLENLVVNGQGGFDYFADQINYDITATLTESTDGGFPVSPSLANIHWPVHCEGSFDDSGSDLCRPDSKAIQSLVVEIAKQELKLKGQSELDKLIEEKAPKELRNLLKGLFRR